MSRKYKSSHRQQGSMLIIALFIIVVISLLAATLSRIVSSTADSIANEVYGAKAYFAAESGMEYGIYHVLRNNQICAVFPDITVISNAANLQFDISNEVGLENCSVAVTCQYIPIDKNGSVNKNSAINKNGPFYLIATGTCEGGKIVTQHKVAAEVKK